MSVAGKGPLRTCVACKESRQQEHLVRYVVAPDGNLLVDYRHRLPGRGAYTCIDVSCLRQAVERNQFQRSFKGKCKKISFENLSVELVSSVEQKIVNLLGMGRKSGQVVSGTNAVLTALRKGNQMSTVVLTEDISETIAEKIETLAERQGVYSFRLLNKDLLGQILGKGERSVVAIEAGTLADAIKLELQKYKQLVREN